MLEGKSEGTDSNADEVSIMICNAYVAIQVDPYLVPSCSNIAQLYTISADLAKWQLS